MSLDKEQVQHIATLARLKLTDGEYAESVEKLSKIVDFVDQLSQADTTDVVTEANNRDDYQQNAAEVADGHYLVPKVIE